MPAYITHYTCGILNYRKLPEGTIKNLIDAAPHAYCIGLAGPDLFFYDLFALKDLDHGTGSIIHEEKTGLFMRNMYQYANGLPIGEREIALSYFIGFVGHYILDCNAHPFVFQISGRGTKENLGKHFCYEAAVDAYTARCYLNKPVRDVDCFKLTHLSRKEERIIFDMIYHVFHETFDNEYGLHKAMLKLLFFNYHLFNLLLKDQYGIKEWLFGPLEKIIFGYSFVAGLFINQNTYHITQKDYNLFRKVFKTGVKEYMNCMPELEKMIHLDSDGEAFFELIGNRCYHTGLEL